MPECTLITGASSGIGEALARLLAAEGEDLILAARREAVLWELARELEAAHGVSVEVLTIDLAQPEAAERLHLKVTGRGREVGTLINCAGFGGSGPLHRRPWEVDRAMIQLNVAALAALTRLFLPAMLERGRGRILNVASTAAFVAGPGMATYFATKAFVLHFTEALAEELRGTGVTATALCPGPTRTPFAARAGVEQSLAFRLTTHSPETVARIGLRAMRRGKPVQVVGWCNGLAAVVPRLLPRAWARRLAGRLMRGGDGSD